MTTSIYVDDTTDNLTFVPTIFGLFFFLLFIFPIKFHSVLVDILFCVSFMLCIFYLINMCVFVFYFPKCSRFNQSKSQRQSDIFNEDKNHGGCTGTLPLKQMEYEFVFLPFYFNFFFL